MKTILRHWLRVSLVVLAAVAISTLGIQASDWSQGIGGRLTGLVYEAGSGPCGLYEVFWRSGSTALCVDAYEASTGANCPVSIVQNPLDTGSNMAGSCAPTTAPNKEPWRFVSYTQAQQLCARAGKRLPTSGEWYQLALGQSDMHTCVVTSSAGAAALTGSSLCMTPSGIYDMVGNVWEWMADTVQDGQYEGRQLPESGYVDLVDGSGVVVRTVAVAGPDFGSDYASIQREGLRGVLRGGFYQSGDDAGIFAQNMSVALDFNGAGVGFRCVRDIQ